MSSVNNHSDYSEGPQPPSWATPLPDDDPIHAEVEDLPREQTDAETTGEGEGYYLSVPLFVNRSVTRERFSTRLRRALMGR